MPSSSWSSSGLLRLPGQDDDNVPAALEYSGLDGVEVEVDGALFSRADDVTC